MSVRFRTAQLVGPFLTLVLALGAGAGVGFCLSL